jgi:hypothetical protein
MYLLPLLGIFGLLIFFLPPIKDALEKIGTELMKLRQIAEANQRTKTKRGTYEESEEAGTRP